MEVVPHDLAERKRAGVKLIYIAGPLFAADDWQIRQNIHRAAQVGFEVAKRGACPVIPHTNTGAVFMGTLTHEFWYDATMELMRRCDAIVMEPGWEKSKGAAAEAAEASDRGMPIFAVYEDLIEAPTIATVWKGMRCTLEIWLKENS